MSFLLGLPIFRGYVKFPGCITLVCTSCFLGPGWLDPILGIAVVGVVVVGWSSQAFVEGSQIEDFEARKMLKKSPKGNGWPGLK